MERPTGVMDMEQNPAADREVEPREEIGDSGETPPVQASPETSSEHRLAEAQAQVQCLERQLADYQTARHRELIQQAVQSWAVDADLVLTMVQKNFSLDADGKLRPVDAQGAPLLEPDGQPLTMERFFQNFRQERPYLVKASAHSGAGSSTQGSAAASAVRPSLAQMAEMPMAQFIKAGGLPQKKTGY
jgi:hypothetical protein